MKLYQALQQAKKIITKKTYTPILKSIGLWDGKLHATDLKRYYVAEIDGLDPKIDCLVSLADLLSIASKEIAIEKQWQKEKAELLNVGGTSLIVTKSHEDFPVFDIKTPKIGFPLDLSALEWTMLAVNPEESRLAIRYIKWDSGKKAFYGTDGHRAHIFRDPNYGSPDLMIHGNLWPILSKMTRPWIGIEIEKIKKENQEKPDLKHHLTIKSESGDEVLATTYGEFDYPDVEAFIPKKPKGSFRFQSDDMRKIAAEIFKVIGKGFSSSYPKPMRISFIDGAIQISAKNEGIEIVRELKGEFDPGLLGYETAYNPLYILEALPKGNKEITMALGWRHELNSCGFILEEIQDYPACLSGNDAQLAVIMPVNINHKMPLPKKKGEK